MRTGTVIHATLREEDLIPAFLKVALECIRDKSGPPELTKRRVDIRVKLKYIERSLKGKNYFNTETSGADIEDLFNILDELAPKGCYFGAHVGDGSDFGFWPVEKNYK
jgi:hypothetical protein